MPQKPKVAGAAGLLAIAQRELDAGHLEAAAEYAKSASAKAPILDDYAQFVRAQAEYRLHDYGEMARSLTHVFDQQPLSPLVGAAASLAVRAELDNDDPKRALELVRKFEDRIPQPEGDLLLARCLAGTGDLQQAAKLYQEVYYGYPIAGETTDAANALVDLKNKLGDQYPPISATAMIKRAQKLMEAHRPAAARTEFTAAVLQLTGAQRDVARVRLGVADFLDNKAEAAFQYLSALKVDDAEADAERIDYVMRCARKLDKHADTRHFVQDLATLHPASRWRLDALVFAADQARVDNDPATYVPLYQACASSFPADTRTAWCDWRVAFESYRKDSDDAYTLMRDHLLHYSASDDANNTLYFFGRLNERKSRVAVARACYEQLVLRFPNTYFAVVARERLKQTSLVAAVADPETDQFLNGLQWHERPEFPSFLPDKDTKSRLDRAELLSLAGLVDLALGELKFGAKNDDDQQNVYAFELAKLATSPWEGMHFIKAYVPNYLYMPLDQAPPLFWKYAFPIPFRVDLEQRSKLQSLDPYLIAALVRQESEFNPQVISHANAYGLMQVLPSTGRELARRLHVRSFRTAQLLTADRNLQLGTYYFRTLTDSFGGQTEYALASYNAGASRAKLWQSWGPYRETAEFIETVPFHETRGYIQIVLRNADVYRRLYAKSTPDLPTYRPKPPPKKSKTRRLRPRKRTMKT